MGADVAAGCDGNPGVIRGIFQGRTCGLGILMFAAKSIPTQNSTQTRSPHSLSNTDSTLAEQFWPPCRQPEHRGRSSPYCARKFALLISVAADVSTLDDPLSRFSSNFVATQADECRVLAAKQWTDATLPQAAPILGRNQLITVWNQLLDRVFRSFWRHFFTNFNDATTANLAVDLTLTHTRFVGQRMRCWQGFFERQACICRVA